MAGIGNIVNAYNLNPKRISSKLSFEMGQVFSAKIVATSELNKELILRLLDGWQFPAKLEKPLDFIPDGLVKLQVEGFEDGKLIIKLVNPKNEDNELSKDSMEDLLFKSKIDVSKDDYDILKNMIKHDMPLTKENISKVKTIFDFRDKLFNDKGEEESFTLKYINSKGIEPESTEGKEIKQILKGFFKELKNISENDILTMLENNIDLSEDNIKSFIKLNGEPAAIYKELKSLANLPNQPNLPNLDLKPESMELKNLLSEIKSSPNFKDEITGIYKSLEQKLESKSLNPKELELFEGLKDILQENVNNDTEMKNTESLTINTKEKKLDGFETVSPKSIEVSTDEDDKVVPNNEKNTDNKNTNNKLIIRNDKNNSILNNKELESVVKEQINDKTEEMKNIVKAFLEKSEKSKPDTFDKVFQSIKDNINDFKVFNSISNQYYCLDVPINLNTQDYNCKLLIKDDRKSGKKIDSKNVSMVVSVKTINMGTIDAYIKVKENNMSVDIKCEENWIKLLSNGKNKIMSELSELGYNTFFNVEKKEIEANLTSCRDFFDDNNLNNINVKV